MTQKIGLAVVRDEIWLGFAFRLLYHLRALFFEPSKLINASVTFTGATTEARVEIKLPFEVIISVHMRDRFLKIAHTQPISRRLRSIIIVFHWEYLVASIEAIKENGVDKENDNHDICGVSEANT